jgi:hypothetical protein
MDDVANKAPAGSHWRKLVLASGGWGQFPLDQERAMVVAVAEAPPE